MHVAKILTTSITGIALAFSMLASTLPANAAVGYHAAYFSESDFLAASPGQSGQFAVGYTNTGDQAWVKGAAGQQANLATAAPLDNTTDFTAGWANGWLSSNRYTAQNAALVAPGQIGFFIYNFTVPAAAAAGEHRFYGREVIDGVTFMEDYGYYQSVTVGTPAITLTSTPASPSMNTTPVISGTGATASSLVTVSEGTTVLCTVTSSATGTFSCTTSALAAGSHTITAKDAAGLTSGSFTYTVDLTKPTVTGASSPFKDSIIVTFSKAMSCGAAPDATSIADGANYTLTNIATSTVVGISSIVTNADCTAATISAVTNNGTQYSIAVAGTVTDKIGNVMGTPKSATFLAAYTTGPVIVSASASAATGGTTSTVTVKWNQPVCGNGAAPATCAPFNSGQYAVDGIAATTTSNQTATIVLTTASPLNAGTSHTVTAFNEKDTAGNVQNPNPQSATFTVATASGNLTLLSATFNPETKKVTATWNAAVANPSTGGYFIGYTDGTIVNQGAATTSTTTPTTVTFTMNTNPFGKTGCATGAASCTLSLTAGSPAETDTFGNAQNPGVQTVNFTAAADTTAPAVVSGTINAAGNAGTVTFSEKVNLTAPNCQTTTCPIVIKNSTGTTVASTVTGSPNLITEAQAPTGTTGVQLTFTALPAGTYTYVVSAGNTADLSFQANPNTAGTVTATLSDTVPPTVAITKTSASVFNFAYNKAMKTGAVAGSASDITNYTLDGTALTAATAFVSCSGTTTCVVTFTTAPAAGGHTIGVGNVQSLAGVVINPNPTTFGFTNP